MVLFASYSGAFGGAERLLLDFSGSFEVACSVACPEGGLARAARSQGLTVFPLAQRSLRLRGGAHERARAASRLVAHGRELRGLVSGLAPDLVIAWGMRSAIACLLGSRLRCPVVFQHNDLLPGPLIGRAVRAAAARADMSIALSHAIAGDLDPTGALGSRLKVVHPGVDVDRFDAAAPPAEPPEVLVLGAITAWKRPDLALEACAIARRAHPDLRVRLVGAPLADDGPELFSELRRRGDALGFVELLGPVADPAAQLARAYCLLHCAEREPFGMAVLEALAAGRSAVVPAAAGPAEIVNRSCGILYEPGDAGAAAAALASLLSDRERAAALGAAGRARAAREFGLEQAQARYAAAVRPLLAGAPRSAGGSPGLALVTVTRNSSRELRGLLGSMRHHLPGVPLVVVDCDSQDDTVQIAGAEPFVRLIALAENIGFGGGCNRGLLEVGEPVTAFVNPDVELVDDSLLALAAEAARRDRAERLLAPLVLYPDGSRQDSVQPVPASVGDLVRSLVPPAALPGPLGVALAPWRATRPRRVGWAVGCALVAKSETLRGLGPFDERIFLYGEDLELGLRAAERGIESWFWPAARVVHHRARSTGREFGGEPFARLARARHDVVARRLGPRRARLDDVAQALTFASRGALKRALGRDADRERRQLGAVLRVLQ
jgi:GT2 family glycosyltransferase/glycosyltransferase involved in cell wall biosynthesis